MTNHNLSILASLALLAYCLTSPVLAAPREAGKGDNGAVQKLQAMVKSLTTERDGAKAEAAKLTTELEQAKKDIAANSVAIKNAVTAKEQTDTELSAQKTSNNEVKGRLEQTNTRLLEVIEKYKVLTQAKNQLNDELVSLKAKDDTTVQQLTTCEEHNIKLYEAGKDLMEKYQNKGTLSGVLQDEPLLQFNSVEMENLVQEYEDKLRSGHYKK